MNLGDGILIRGGRRGIRAAGSIPNVAAWYDPSDLTTLFQDDAATTPVTAAGQSVAVMRDKSGNNRHMTQATPGARPTYQSSGGLHWLQFDGTDDVMNAAVPVSAYPFDFHVAGTGSATEGGYLSIFESATAYKALYCAVVSANFVTLNRTLSTPFDLITTPGAAGGGYIRGYWDGANITVQFETTIATLASAYGFGSPSALKMGANRATNFLTGRIYQAAIYSRVLSAAEAYGLRRIFRDKMGLL